MKLVPYILAINGVIDEYTSAFTPLGALKAYAMANADDCGFFKANIITLQSPRKLYTYHKVEYFADYDEIFMEANNAA